MFLSISNCEFSDSEVNDIGGSIYIIYENETSQKQEEMSACTFKWTTSTINKDAVYKNISVEYFNATISFDKCHFVQTSQVNTLIYFSTKLSSKFSFIYNIINFTDTNSYFLRCNTNLAIQERYELYF